MKALSPGKKAALAALAAALLAAAAIAVHALWSPAGVARAPQLVYTTVDGQLIIPEDLRDKVVLVNFWATDCVPCLAEMPRLVETHDKYRPLGLAIIAVAMSYDPPNRVLEYTRRYRIPFSVALDLQGEAARGFGKVSATPTTFVVDRRGNVVKRYQGEPDFAQLHRLLEEKLAEPA
jgi:thiol-disulfide isomerase/thioredoxin